MLRDILSGKDPEDQASSLKEKKQQELNRLSLVQIIILIQFTVSAALTIFAVVGVSISQPIGFILLLALLQFVITIPGFAYHFTQKAAHFFAYVLLQAITCVCEILWFVYSVITNTYTVITVIILLLLICVQTAALLAATILRHVHVNLSDSVLEKSLGGSRTRTCGRRGGSRSRTRSRSRSHRRRRSRRKKHAKGSKSSSGDASLSFPSRERRTSKDLEQGPDESIKEYRRGMRKRLAAESWSTLKDGRRRIRELAKQLRAKDALARTHSDTKLNKDSKEGKEISSSRKSKSVESTTAGTTTIPVTGILPTAVGGSNEKAPKPVDSLTQSAPEPSPHPVLSLPSTGPEPSPEVPSSSKPVGIDIPRRALSGSSIRSTTNEPSWSFKSWTPPPGTARAPTPATAGASTPATARAPTPATAGASTPATARVPTPATARAPSSRARSVTPTPATARAYSTRTRTGTSDITTARAPSVRLAPSSSTSDHSNQSKGNFASWSSSSGSNQGTWSRKL